MLALMYQRVLVLLAFAWFVSGASIADLDEDPIDSYLRTVEDLFRSYDENVEVMPMIGEKCLKSCGNG